MKLAFPFGLLVSLAISGCAAPGSSITRAGVSGQIVNANGRPKANVPIELLLPGSYGLAGLDAAWGRPEDYGHSDQSVRVRTDAAGRFEHAFPGTTYSIAFFLFPPLGAIPRQPPPPFFAFRSPATGPDWHLVGRNHGHLECRIRDHTSGALRPEPAQGVSGDFELRDFPPSASGQPGIRGWEARLRVVGS